MRRPILPALIVVLGACAGAPLAVPEADRLSPDEQAAYRAALSAWIAGDPESARGRLTELERVEPWYVPAHVLRQDAVVSESERSKVAAWYAAQAAERADDAARVLLEGRMTPREAGARERLYRRAHALDSASPWPALALSYELQHAAAYAFQRSIELADDGFPEQSDEQLALAGRLDAEARELADRLVAAFPRLADVHAGAAEVFLSRGEALGERDTLGRALELAERAADLDPEHPGRHALLARVRRALIDDRGAEEALRRALELDDDDPDLLAGLGRVLLDLGRPEDARGVLRNALRLRPTDGVIATDLGVAAQRVGDLDAAVAHLELATTLVAADARPWQALALVQLERDDAAQARRALNAYIARNGIDRAWAEETLRQLDENGNDRSGDTR